MAYEWYRLNKSLRKFCRKKVSFFLLHQKSQTYHVFLHIECEVFDFTLIWIIARTHTRENISLVYMIWIVLFSLNYDSRDLCESIKCSFVIQKQNSNNNNGKYVTFTFSHTICISSYSFSFHANETSTGRSVRPFEDCVATKDC